MIAAARIALVLAGSLVVGAGIGAGVGAVANVVRPAAVDDTRDTDALGTDPAGPPSDTPVDPNDPDHWLIDFGSVGPVQVGGPFAQLPTALAGFDDLTDYALASCPVLVGDFATPDLYFVLAEWQGAVDLIDMGRPDGAGRPGPRTAEGIGFGSTMDEVSAAYPSGQLEGEGYDGDPYFGISDGSSRIVFSVNANAGVDRIVVTPYNGVPEEYCG